jgi:hypothetical protein
VYEQGIVDGLRALIIANESDLVDGISYQGAQKNITDPQVVTSTLTPPVLYPHIMIIVPGARERSEKTVPKATQQPSRMATYSTMMEITEQAVVVEGEDFPFEQMQTDFRLLTDRIIYTIRTQNWITFNSIKFRLARGEGDNDRVVNKRNNSGYWQDTELNWWATLNCVLTFDMEACVDDTPIIP